MLPQLFILNSCKYTVYTSVITTREPSNGQWKHPCQQRVCLETYFGLPVALEAHTTAEARGQQAAEGELQEGDVLPEEANSRQGE